MIALSYGLLAVRLLASLLPFSLSKTQPTINYRFDFHTILLKSGRKNFIAWLSLKEKLMICKIKLNYLPQYNLIITIRSLSRQHRWLLKYNTINLNNSVSNYFMIFIIIVRFIGYLSVYFPFDQCSETFIYVSFITLFKKCLYKLNTSA